MAAEITPHDKFLAEKADVIRGWPETPLVTCVIGRLLVEAKARCKHGQWLPWLEREFGWSDDTARNYMGIYALIKSRNFRDLGLLPVSSLYLLAAPSTPEAARDEVSRGLSGGEKVSVGEVRKIVVNIKHTPTPLNLRAVWREGSSRPLFPPPRPKT